MKTFDRLSADRLSPFVVIFLVAGIAYLPFIKNLGYTYDDWYLMWAAKAYGPEAFFPIFSVDRPLRAWLMYPLYQVFGENPLWYHWSAYLLRVLGGLVFGWTLHEIWPQRPAAAWSMALLFTIYPGFLSQPNPIDYQSHLAALFLAILSLAATVKSWMTTGAARFSWVVAAFLTGWLYLGLMEYYIGFEGIRLFLILILASRNQTGWHQWMVQAVRYWLPFALVPVSFVLWRAFIFVGERKATNPGAQLMSFLIAPWPTLIRWVTGLVEDVWEVLAGAWMTPLSQVFHLLQGGSLFAGIAAGVVAVLMVWWMLSALENGVRVDENPRWTMEAFLLGAGSMIAGLVPVILANREVAFPYFSRYTLIASWGAVIFLTALIYLLPQQITRRMAVGLLVSIAVLTHLGNGVKFSIATAVMNNFWWQVAWRVPHFEQNVTLITLYPQAPLQEDYFIWGPANLIYYPVRLSEKDIQPGIFAALPDEETVSKVLARERQQYDNRRKIITYANYRNILLMIQNQKDDCVRVIDGHLPEVWQKDPEMFLQMAPFSEIDHVLTGPWSPQPPLPVFGPEPEHGWCFYYQKASLARQRGDWNEVLRLGEEARARKVFSTANEIEWLPFIQAYAIAGNTSVLDEIASHFHTRFDTTACRAIAHPQVPPEMLPALEERFCLSVAQE